MRHLLLLLALLVAAPAHGAIAKVQSIGGFGSTRCDTNGATATSKTCTFGTSVTSGNYLTAACTYYNFSGSVTASVTDNINAGSWTQDATVKNTTGKIQTTVNHLANTAGGSMTVTCTVSAATYIVVHIYEFSGMGTGSVDVSGTYATDSSSASFPVNANLVVSSSTTHSPDLIFASVGYNNASTPTIAGGYTSGENSSTCGTTVVCATDEWGTTSSTGATPVGNMTFSPALSGGYSGVIATYPGATSATRRKIIVVQGDN